MYLSQCARYNNKSRYLQHICLWHHWEIFITIIRNQNSHNDKHQNLHFKLQIHTSVFDTIYLLCMQHQRWNKEKFYDRTQLYHSMAIVNLNKSEELVTNTTTASKYMPKRPRICINGNPPFQTSLHKIFKSVLYDVKFTSQ